MENILFEKYEKNNRIAVITLNRPKALNAFNRELIIELTKTLEETKKDESIYCVVIKSCIAKAFTAGGDVKEENTLHGKDAYDFGLMGKKVMSLIEEIEVPVISAVDGYALGGGMGIILASDITVAAKTAKIGIPTINLGTIPGWGETQRLPRIVGKSLAKDILFTGRLLSGEEAYKLNIVEYLVESEELLNKAFEIAETIADRAPIAMRSMKKVIDKGMETDIVSGLKMENEFFQMCYDTDDHTEAMAAFLEKRPHKPYENK